MNTIEATRAVAVACAACPTAASFLDEKALEAMIAAWVMVLEDLDASDVNAALKRYLATTPDKLPSPGRLRQIVDETRHGRRRSGMDAMGDVVAAIRRVGVHRTPTFDDSIVARVVEQMGWANWCNSENIVADRAHGAKIYDALAAGAVEDRSVATLPGVARPALPSSSTRPIAALVGDVLHELDGAR